jgi:hypothetical protein
MTSNDNNWFQGASTGDSLVDPIDVDELDDATPTHDSVADELGTAPLSDSAKLTAARRSRIGAAFRSARRGPQSP